MELSIKQITVIFKALCDENRVQIFRILQNGELCACHLLEDLHLSQPTLSHHMKVLCDSGLVVGRKDGKWMHYSISKTGMRNVKKYFELFDAGTNKDSEMSCCKNE